MGDSLTEDKISIFKVIFDLYDKDKDGSITTKELGDVMRAKGADPTDSELQEMISEVDKDNTGKIEFNQFLDIFIRKMRVTDPQDELIDAFKVFDKDGNGFITASEFHHTMILQGNSYTVEEVQEMLKDIDTDGDGCINFLEFVKMMPPK